MCNSSGRTRERRLNLSVSHFLPNFSKNCVLSGGTQRRTFALVPDEEMKILINNNSNTQPLRLSHTLDPLCHDGLVYTFFILINVQSRAMIEPFICGHNIGKLSLTSESAVAAHCLRSVYIRDENYSHFHVIIIFWKYT